MTALVTAGGTSEPLDDVRVLTNISTGRFGHMLANELALQGLEVTELLRRASVPLLGSTMEKLSGGRVRVEPFTTAASLREAMLDRPAPSIVLHAAAVSDYSPVKAEGKLRSDADELTITMKRNPKILAELREVYGKKTFIAGFKLLSGVSEEELIAAATQQLHANKLNMVIANDLQKLRDGQHPVIVVTAEGGTLRFDGDRHSVAKELVAFILKRARTSWFESRPDGSGKKMGRSLFAATLGTAQMLHLFYDSSGNVSCRVGDSGYLVSPRQVDKSELTPDDGVMAQVDLDGSIVHYVGERKPSIDTGMSAMLYQHFPKTRSMMHFHSGWGKMNTQTRFPFPCGAREEAEEVWAVQPADSDTLAVELIHHGFLLGLEEGDHERLTAEWAFILHEYKKHLEEVGESNRLRHELLKPVWDGSLIVGVIQADPAGASVFLTEAARGRGVGAAVVRQLKERKFVVKTVDDCGVRDYYKARGFVEEWDEADRVFLLRP